MRSLAVVINAPDLETARGRLITTRPHGARASVGDRGRRRRRSGLRSLGRTRPERTRLQRAHRSSWMRALVLGYLLGTRHLHHGGRRHRGRRRGRFFRLDHIRYIRLPACTKARLPSTTRGTPERRTAVGAVGCAMPDPPPQHRAAHALRAHGCAPIAKDLHPRAPGAAPKPSVHPSSRPLGRGWTPEAFDGTVIHGGRVFRCARHEGSGVQTRAFTYSNPRTLRRHCP